MKGLRNLLSLGAGCVLSLLAVNQAQGHGVVRFPILPLHHAGTSFATTHLTNLLVRGKGSGFVGLPGFSGATRATFAFNKAIASAAYSTGSSVALTQQLTSIQQLTNGQFFGRTYYLQNNGSYTTLPPAVYALGSNPLNGATTSPVTISNYLNNTGSFSTLQQGTVTPSRIMSAITTLHGKFLPSSPSGALRSLLSEQKNLATSNYNSGYQSVTSIFKSPILGGQFAGSYFIGSGGGHYSLDLGDAPNNGKFIFAFGNSPLFNAPASLVIPNPASYIAFANGRVLNISDGLLIYTRYVRLGGTTFTLGGGGSRLLAIGSNPFNQGILNVTLPAGAVTYFHF